MKEPITRLSSTQMVMERTTISRMMKSVIRLGQVNISRAYRPKPSKTAILAQPVDIKWINPSGRGLDEVQKERRIRAKQRMKGR